MQYKMIQKTQWQAQKNRGQLEMFWVAVQRLCSFLYCICIQAPTWFLARIFQTLLQTQRSKIQCNCKVWYKHFGAYSMEIYSFWIFPWVCCKLQTFESQPQIHGVHGDNFSQCTYTMQFNALFMLVWYEIAKQCIILRLQLIYFTFIPCLVSVYVILYEVSMYVLCKYS